jgi:glucan phosphoethanolaminetransferase (alkaline phosphatase superfamily)
MTTNRPRQLWFFILLVTIPCPSTFLYCYGLLPGTALLLGVIRYGALTLRDPAALVFSVAFLLHTMVYGAVLYWLAAIVARRVPTARIARGWRVYGMVAIALLILAFLPIYTFDCMDGASSRWCSWLDLHAGWFGVVAACGDFHW